MIETRISNEEEASLKTDLLNFIHSVACGKLDKPEHINALVPAVYVVARFFG